MSMSLKGARVFGFGRFLPQVADGLGETAAVLCSKVLPSLLRMNPMLNNAIFVCVAHVSCAVVLFPAQEQVHRLRRYLGAGYRGTRR